MPHVYSGAMRAKQLLAVTLTLVAAPALAHADIGDRLTAALHAGSLLAYLLAFVGGVLTSLTPCVYPLIPITLSIFGARGENVSRARAITLACVYVGGIGVMYTSLGVGVALTGRAFGTFMGSPWVIVPIAALFLVMAASMFGAFELNLPMGLQTRLSQLGGAGFGGAFVMGLVGGIIAAPCTGPVLASLLAFVATTKSVAFGGSLLFTYALGMGVLFFFLAASAASLPKSGAWMETVKSVFGVVMIVAALYFLRNVWKPLYRYGDWRQQFALWNGGAILVGVALGGIHLSFHDAWLARVRKGVGVAAICAGSFGMIAWSLTAEPLKALEWIKGEQPALAASQAQHKPVLLDFSADWCIPCKEMEHVFSVEGVQRELSRYVIAKVDCTDDDDASVKALKVKYHADTLPTVVLLSPSGEVAQRWNRIVAPAELLAKLKEVR